MLHIASELLSEPLNMVVVKPNLPEWKFSPSYWRIHTTIHCPTLYPSTSSMEHTRYREPKYSVAQVLVLVQRLCLRGFPCKFHNEIIYFFAGNWFWWFNNHWRVPPVSQPWNWLPGCSAVRLCSLLWRPHREGPGTLPKQECQGVLSVPCQHGHCNTGKNCKVIIMYVALSTNK